MLQGRLKISFATTKTQHSKKKKKILKERKKGNESLLYFMFSDLRPKLNLLHQIKSLHNTCMPFEEKFHFNQGRSKSNRG